MDEKKVDDLKDDVAYLFNKHIMSIQNFRYAHTSHVQQELFLFSLRKHIFGIWKFVAYLFNNHIMSIQHFWYACISHVQQELFLLSLRKHIFAFENL